MDSESLRLHFVHRLLHLKVVIHKFKIEENYSLHRRNDVMTLVVKELKGMRKVLDRLSDLTQLFFKVYDEAIELNKDIKFKVANERLLRRGGHKRECKVCLDDFSIKKMVKLVCGHVICQRCCDKLQSNECPYCRCHITSYRKLDHSHDEMTREAQ